MVTTSFGGGLEVARVVALAVVLAAADERVQLDSALSQRGQLPRHRDEHASPPSRQQGVGVAADEEDDIVIEEVLGPDP